MNGDYSVPAAGPDHGGLVQSPRFGPAPGWGTALGLFILSVSLVVWLNAQSIVIVFLDRGMVTESSVSATLGTLRQNAAAGSVVGSIFSSRIAVAILQFLDLGLLLAFRPSLRGQRTAGPEPADRRPWRYASDVDPGGTAALLAGTQQFLADLPRKTAAVLSEAAVFLWGLVVQAAHTAPAVKAVDFLTVINEMAGNALASDRMHARSERTVCNLQHYYLLTIGWSVHAVCCLPPVLPAGRTRIQPWQIRLSNSRGTKGAVKS